MKSSETDLLSTHSTRSARSLLLAAQRTERPGLWLATLLLCVHQLGESMVPVIIGAAISQAVAVGSLTGLWWWLVLLAVDFVFFSLSYRFGSRVMVRTQERVEHRLRMSVTDRALAPAGGIRVAPGELVSRATSDASRAAAMTEVIASTTAAVLVVIVSTVLLLRYSLLLGAIIVVGTVLLTVVIGALAERFGELSDAEQQATSRAAVLVEDYLRGMRALVGIGAQRTAAGHHAVAAESALGAGVRAASGQGLRTALTVTVTGFFLAVITGVGGLLAMNGELSLGSLIASLGLAQFLTGPLQVLAGAVTDVSRSVTSAERLRMVLGSTAAPTPLAYPAIPVDGDIVIRGIVVPGIDVGRLDVRGIDGGLDVRTDHAEGGRPVDLTAEHGRTTGIALTDPALADLLCAALAGEGIASGSATVGGVPVGDLTLDDLRELVLVAPREARLFPGSVEENIAGVGRVADITGPVTAAMVDEVLRSLPDGPATDVGSDGFRLSGGQRQRIALARALAADPAILVLRDPTTAVDSATEQLIAGRLLRLRKGRTTVLISNSPGLLSHCDRVLFVHPDGVDTGSHDSLLAVNADYRALVRR